MAKNKDYYSILGIDRNATDDDIKKAFKKAALKYHPDRQTGKSDAEKKAAEEKFKEINEANDVLSDPQKRANYDRFGSADGPSGFGGFESGFGDFNFNDIFNMFHGGQRNSGRQEPRKASPVQVEIKLSLEDIYNGDPHRTIEYNIHCKCKDCDGNGGSESISCPHCNGTGMITETQVTRFGRVQSMHPCGHCGGSGRMFKNVCHTCGGTGFTTKTVRKDITIPAGVPNGYATSVVGAGNESTTSYGQNGDLIIVMMHNIDTTRYRIVGNDIYERVSIPYYKCVLGDEMTLVLPNKETVKYKVPAGAHEEDQIVIHNKGLHNGNYIISVHVDIPKNPSKKEKKLLEEIKDLNK